jgi:hypothetical protein
MTADSGSLELSYQAVDGSEVQDEAAVLAEEAGPSASPRTRRLRLNDGTEVLQLVVAAGGEAADYDRLDSEILAGLRLARLARDDDDSLAERGRLSPYPAQVGRLHGYATTGAEPFALVYHYRGEPLGTTGRRLLPRQHQGFQISLLEGLCWLAEAGLAHRGISPTAVRWDGELSQVQITDFSLATVFGVPREVAGEPPWAAPEQRPGQLGGYVTERDDVWAAGRLIYLVTTGVTLTRPEQLADSPLAGLLDGVLDAPAARPTARQLLERLGVAAPVARKGRDDGLEAGRERFRAARAAKLLATPVAGPAVAAVRTVASGPAPAGASRSSTPPVAGATDPFGEGWRTQSAPPAPPAPAPQHAPAPAGWPAQPPATLYPSPRPVPPHRAQPVAAPAPAARARASQRTPARAPASRTRGSTGCAVLTAGLILVLAVIALIVGITR